MELEYAFIYNKETKESLNKLFEAKLHGNMLKNINTLQRGLENHFRAMKKEFTETLKKFAEVNEKGDLIEPDGQGTFKIKEGEGMNWNKAVMELMSKKFKVNCTKLNVNLVYSNGISLSSLDLQNLEPILEGLE